MNIKAKLGSKPVGNPSLWNHLKVTTGAIMEATFIKTNI